MNFNNPFSILNSSNINNLNLKHSKDDMNKSIIRYVKDLIHNKKEYNDLDYFCNTRLNDYQLSNSIHKDNLSTNYYLHLHGSTKDKKGFLRIPNNVYIISLENYGKTWNSQIIHYLIERMKLQNDFSESFIKSIIIETSLLELFELQKVVNNNQISIEEILNNNQLYIQKYFKVYKANDRLNDFELSSEEKHNFYSGLFKLPAKSYIVYKKNVKENGENNEFTLIKSKKSKNKSQSLSKKININSSASINSNWKVMSHRKIKDALLNPKNKLNQDLIHQLIYPSDINIRIEKNDYYTIHLKYLTTLKTNLKFIGRFEKMHTLQTNLSVNVKTLSNSKKTKIVSFKNILQKLVFKEKPTNEKPLILFCNFCTINNEQKYYPQNDIVKNDIFPSPPLLLEQTLNRKANNKIFLDYEKYVLNEHKLSKNQYLEEIQRMIFDLHLADAVLNIYINKINSKLFNIKIKTNLNLMYYIKKNIYKYIELIKKDSENIEEIKAHENVINDFYNSEKIEYFDNIILKYKDYLYQTFLENDINKINMLCLDILHETQRLFKNMKKNQIYYNSKKRIFKEINYFYNTFYPPIHFFTANCTYSYSFIQYLLFIVYAHIRKVIKSLVYHSFENISYINNSNNLNMKIKDDYISRIINIHYKYRNKKNPFISYYDSILYHVIYDLHKIYTNNHTEFSLHKKQFKSLLGDLGDYYDLYLKNNYIYENSRDLSNNFINPENVFQNRNYNENEKHILENRRK